jgi:hypothetical protein
MFIDPHFFDLGTSCRWVISFTPRPLNSRGKSPRYLLERTLGGPQGRSGWHGEEKIGDPTETRTPIPRNWVHSARRPYTDWQGNPKYSEKTCPSATLSTTNRIWPDPGSNPGRRGGKPATNRLSYCAAWRPAHSQSLYRLPIPALN